jgi:hypothetical protein
MERRTIAERYELLERLGDSTWRAADTELGREVLIRLPAGKIAAATLAHPNIVRVFDQGEVDGEPYAVLEYLPGGSLEQRLAAGPLTEAEASSLGAAVTAALDYAHAEGVTHGALGPANVLLDAEGRAKVTGFTGHGETEEDTRALGALLQTLGADAIAGPEADVTAVLEALPQPRSRRVLVLAAVAALALVAAGIGAAFLATSGGSKPPSPTSSLSVPVPTGSSTHEPAVSQPATTVEATTEEKTTGTTSAGQTTAPPTTSAPPPTVTELPPITELPPTTTEELPPTTTEAPLPTTLPATTTG